MTVVELDSRRPHVTVPMKCTDCAHELVSVHMEASKVKFWECPACHQMAATEVPNG